MEQYVIMTRLFNNFYTAFTFYLLAMPSLAAAGRPRLSETQPKLFVFETSYYAFCGGYCFEYVASQK